MESITLDRISHLALAPALRAQSRSEVFLTGTIAGDRITLVFKMVRQNVKYRNGKARYSGRKEYMIIRSGVRQWTPDRCDWKWQYESQTMIECPSKKRVAALAAV